MAQTSSQSKPRRRIIIDTDPGNDDVLAILLALSASASDLEVLLISAVSGNVDVHACLRNIVATFHILDREIQWRKSQGLPEGLDGIRKFKPVVAVGAGAPLEVEGAVKTGGDGDNADYFHGRDGLGGSTLTHPEFNPDESWRGLFEKDGKGKEDKITRAAKEITNGEAVEREVKEGLFTNFIPSTEPAHKEILRFLRKEETGTISVVSIGPLTNLALAAAEDPETFLRCKEVVSMGGAIDKVGNVTPNAEFNVWADPHAAARVYALTSQVPSSTMPPVRVKYGDTILPAYPPHLSKRLKLVLMSLDITEDHVITRSLFEMKTEGLAKRGSPLAQWMRAFLIPMLDKMASLHIGHEDDAAFALHDPLCIWYLLTDDNPAWRSEKDSGEDIRVETLGQWTKGMTVTDRRPRRRRNSDGEAPHDRGNWLGRVSGNRLLRMVQSPGKADAGTWMLDRIMGFVQ